MRGVPSRLVTDDDPLSRGPRCVLPPPPGGGMGVRLRGRARVLPGEGVAVPDAMSWLAVRAAIERRARPPARAWDDALLAFPRGDAGAHER